jgi:hypothetical protein
MVVVVVCPWFAHERNFIKFLIALYTKFQKNVLFIYTDII